ncbi:MULTISPECIES: hypothetical protein [unclassified Colwellia]|jgi:hypothetical protein|uniref:hypothetical protein n=1 Tax=unclassified Colwellia TaxID=196834 RepID=UPI0015F4BC05|nr:MULTISPECIES: hypothetical protein [unclassified Colwellia]MBA6256422.1 hypothetical protein [Colwellia sp. MB3u-28]MBA6260376.1 hypothetical protein [Colwellia sp. MB3u-41]
MLSISTLNDSKILVCIEYFPEAISLIKKLGKVNWDSLKKGWIVDSDFENEVKNILVDFYGSDGSFRPKTINIEVTATNDIDMVKQPIRFAGKVVASAYSRDSGAITGDNVALIEGNVNSGGSAKNWETSIAKGSRFKLMHVNEQLLKHSENNLFNYEIIECKKVDSLSRLRNISDEDILEECKSRKLI